MIKTPKAFEVKVSKALSIFIVLTHIVYFIIIKSNKQKFEVKKLLIYVKQDKMIYQDLLK